MKKILFQGDSITDMGRRDSNRPLGNDGYVSMIGEMNIFDEVVNRGCSGHGILKLLERWQRDTLDIKPDVLSIYIGVNDVLHVIRDKDGVDETLFYDAYDIILKHTQRILPNTEIIIISPYIFDNGPEVKYCYDEFKEKLNKIIDVTYRLSQKYSLKYVPLQEIFDEKVKEYPKEELFLDGIHPTTLGHEIIRDAFLKAYNS